jgi:hypothetical protein
MQFGRRGSVRNNSIKGISPSPLSGKADDLETPVNNLSPSPREEENRTDTTPLNDSLKL